MFDLVEEISKAKAEDLEGILRAVLARYGELFPDWEVTTISVQKTGDRNAQIDQHIQLLTRLKQDI